MNWKVKYLLASARKWALQRGYSCPSCGCSDSHSVSTKYIVTSLRRCSKCDLLFRAPTTSPAENKAFYQDEYKESFTTDLPSIAELAEFKKNSLKGTSKDLSGRLKILKSLEVSNGARLCDFGCSWGYASWQFGQAGYCVQSFEISAPRAEFAKSHLDADVVLDTGDLTGLFDVFFSSHVLEHVPAVREVIDLGFKLLRPGGYFVAFTPNGSDARRKRDERRWQRAWGMKHPNHIDEVYYRKAFASMPYYLSSPPYSHKELKEWSQQPAQYVGNLDGSELMIVARKEK